MNTLLAATPTQVRMLERRLVPGLAYSFLLRAGPAFSPPSFVAHIRPAEGGYQLRVAEPIEYIGPDEQVRDFVHRGWHEEDTLVDLILFFRGHFAPLPDADEIGIGGHADGNT
jgi:hypothetical protein